MGISRTVRYRSVGATRQGRPSPGPPRGQKKKDCSLEKIAGLFLSAFLHRSYDILRIRKIWASPESKGSEQNESLDMHWGVTGCSMLTMQNFWQPGGQN